ncbi:hypothetical protein M758_UG030400 [Ceratodon purpureus]|nr:hypothetical protein M758_UG030400 [Ceratodon purpureus]
MQVVPAMKDGLVADWEVVESLWDHALRCSCNFNSTLLLFLDKGRPILEDNSRIKTYRITLGIGFQIRLNQLNNSPQRF